MEGGTARYQPALVAAVVAVAGVVLLDAVFALLLQRAIPGWSGGGAGSQRRPPAPRRPVGPDRREPFVDRGQDSRRR
jgi:hypothetical protein